MAVKRASTSGSATPRGVKEAAAAANTGATSSSSSAGGFSWTPEAEIQLFKAILGGPAGLKPAGIAKNFHMALIHDQLQQAGIKDVTPSAIWDHLETFFNLEAVDEIESKVSGPGSPPAAPVEFALPKDFQSVITEMRKSGKISAAETPVTTPCATPKESKKSSAAAAATPKETPAAASSFSSETPKSASGTKKRPTRSTPSSTPAKRRK